MAYFTKEDKATVASNLKAFMPKDWKYSLSIKDNSTIQMTISAAPISIESLTENTYLEVNTRHCAKQFASSNHKDLIVKIVETLNEGNYNNSDSQTDYFDVGHYISMSFGSYKSPFKSTEA